MNFDVMLLGMGITIVGIVMTIFHKSLGTRFAKAGQSMFRNSPESILSKKQIETICSETYSIKTAPRIMKLLGIVNIIQGAFFAALGFFIQP